VAVLVPARLSTGISITARISPTTRIPSSAAVRYVWINYRLSLNSYYPADLEFSRLTFWSSEVSRLIFQSLGFGLELHSLRDPYDGTMLQTAGKLKIILRKVLKWISGRAFNLRSLGRGFDSYGGQLCSNIGYVVRTYVPLSANSIIRYWLKDGDVLRLGR